MTVRIAVRIISRIHDGGHNRYYATYYYDNQSNNVRVYDEVLVLCCLF